MKKISFIAMMAVGAMVLVSCGKSAPKANLKNNIDTVSYAVGMANGEGLSMYLAQMGIDSTYTEDVIKGIVEGFNTADNKKKVAYNLGLGLGQQIDQMYNGMSQQAFAGDSTKSLSRDNFLAGFIAAARGEKNPYAPAQIEAMFTALSKDALEKNLKEGQEFLAANAKKAGVKTTESGLQYKIIKEGKGNIPTDSTQVRLHYEGRTIDGKVFDSSYTNHEGEPIVMYPRQFIPGFCEALTMMPVGSTWEVYIPSELAYGSQQMRDIKPNSALIFKIELLSITSEEKK